MSPACTSDMSHAGPATELKWYLAQMKGSTDEVPIDADIVSCLEFNSDGSLLATGDKGGRIVIFKRDTWYDEIKQRHRPDYSFYTTFTSHEPEFDYLKSLEIEEKINQIKWLPHQHSKSHHLLSTNDKTIKLWRITERTKREPSLCLNFGGHLLHATLETKLEHIRHQGYVKLPRVTSQWLHRVQQQHEDGVPLGIYDSRSDLSRGAPVVDTVAKQVYANAHAYHINAISVNSDQETFLTSDDLRINVWHLDCTNQSFNIVDIKPANMEDLTEVITAAEFHPKECALFVYSSSKGVVRLCDMRQNALCDKHALLFDEPDDPVNKSFFSEIINSISDVRFSSDGSYLLTRDYLSLKVWDVRMTQRGPVECYPVHEYLRSRLCALYENDCIFDKFECCWSPDDRYVMTGSYNSFFRVFDRAAHTDVTLEASRESMRQSEQPLSHRRVVTNANTLSGSSGGNSLSSGGGGVQIRRRGDLTADALDYTRKLLHLHWNPADNTIAMATANNLFILVGESCDLAGDNGTTGGDGATNPDHMELGQDAVNNIGDNGASQQ